MIIYSDNNNIFRSLNYKIVVGYRINYLFSTRKVCTSPSLYNNITMNLHPRRH